MSDCCESNSCCDPKTSEQIAFELMRRAFSLMCLSAPSRENSLAKTKLEEAMMWCNKDRAIKGQLTKSPTHVQQTE
jgi:hypothetical protein